MMCKCISTKYINNRELCFHPNLTVGKVYGVVVITKSTGKSTYHFVGDNDVVYHISHSAIFQIFKTIEQHREDAIEKILL